MRACLFEIDNGFAYRDMIIDGKTVELCDFFGFPSPFLPIKTPPDTAKIAIVRDPLKRLISTYRNRVIFYCEVNAVEMTRHLVTPSLPETPSFRAFVENLSEYAKIPAIAHHVNPQVHFLGKDPAYYDSIFRVERLPEVEAFLSNRAGRQITLPRKRKDGPKLSRGETESPDLRAIVAERYAADYRFIAAAVVAAKLSATAD